MTGQRNQMHLNILKHMFSFTESMSLLTSQDICLPSKRLTHSTFSARYQKRKKNTAMKKRREIIKVLHLYDRTLSPLWLSLILVQSSLEGKLMFLYCYFVNILYVFH